MIWMRSKSKTKILLTLTNKNMTEYYRPENEMLSAYGDESQVEQQNSGYTEQYFSEESNTEETPPEEPIHVESNEKVEVMEEIELIQQAALYIESLPEVERVALDKLANKQAEITDLINSENLAEREDARLSALGSAFAAAPANDIEKNNQSSWKRVLEGATKGARVATIAVAMALPLSSLAQEKEDPAITHTVNELFGKSLQERITGRRAAEKARYAQLEKEKRELVHEMSSIYEIAPRNEAERIRFKLLEATRDRKLAEIKEQQARFVKEVMNADLNDPEVVAYVEKKEAQFKELKLKVVAEYEDAIRKEFKNRTDYHRENELRRRLDNIDREQKRLAEREINRYNRSTSYYYY